MDSPVKDKGGFVLLLVTHLAERASIVSSPAMERMLSPNEKVYHI